MFVFDRPEPFKCLVRAIFVFGLTASPGMAALSDDDAPPAPSETTTACAEGQIFDEAQKKCVAPEGATDDQAALYRDARELAANGRLDEAARVLDVMAPSDKVLTYRGFIARKRGDWDGAVSFYEAALSANPDNLLARSYYGMGLAAQGKTEAARAQLVQIRARGGRMSWPEWALKSALRGAVSGY